jgi:RNA polymerase subunit RPABC4/transcription elongation factor Spt4
VVTRRARRAKELEAELERRQLDRVMEADQRKRERRDAYDAQLRAHEESVARVKAAEGRPRLSVLVLACTACGKEYSDGTSFCPSDGSKLQTVEKALAPTGKVCPACGRGYDADTRICAVDGEELVPYAVLPARKSTPPQAKICPTCGDRFDGSAGFCGKDGTVLVLLN